MSKPSRASLWICTGLSLALAACGGNDGAASGNATANVTAASDGSATSAETPAVPAKTLAEGPDVCFRAIAQQIGADTKVSEITSFFSVGSEIDSSADEPRGTMTTCSVEYQDPKDARKLLSISMDMNTGQFSQPSPVEITVSGGDAAAFKLEDYLIPLSRVNAAALKTIMESQQASMDKIYSKHAWSGVRLSAPDAFNDNHTLRLDIEGRLASNDIKEGGYASVSTDGKTITTNYLKP